MMNYLRGSWGRNKGAWLMLAAALTMIAGAVVAHFGFGVQ